jgi:negative regulator of genetic competence, sporulation and motility
MELILISDSKLKVMLTPDDMASYDITCDTIDYDNTETRRAFWNILDEAKHKTGFDAASDKVFIQVYPSKNGGCELYVTKLVHNGNSITGASLDGECPDFMKSGPSLDYTNSININIKRRDINNASEIYAFSDIDTLITACQKLDDMGFYNDSWVYKIKFKSKTGDNINYYLILSDIDLSFSMKPSKLSPYWTISEYGERKTGRSLRAYIDEYYTCICDGNAVNVLSKM